MKKIWKGLIIAFSVVAVGCSDYDEVMENSLSGDIDCRALVTKTNGDGKSDVFESIAGGSDIIESCRVEIESVLAQECHKFYGDMIGASTVLQSTEGYNPFSLRAKRACGTYLVNNLYSGYEIEFKHGVAYLTITDGNRLNSNKRESHYVGNVIESVSLRDHHYAGHVIYKVVIRTVSGDERVVFAQEREYAESIVSAVKYSQTFHEVKKSFEANK